MLLALVVIVAIAEIGASSVDTKEFSRHLGANSADNSFEQFGYCDSLEKEEAFECFRDMAAMVSEERNTELVSKDAALVNENTAMASTTAMLQSSLEIRDADQHSFLEPMDILDQPSDGALPYCDVLFIHTEGRKKGRKGGSDGRKEGSDGRKEGRKHLPCVFRARLGWQAPSNHITKKTVNVVLSR